LAWFVNSVHDQAWLDFLFLTLSHVGVFALFWVLVSKLAVKNQPTRSGRGHQKKKGNGTKPDYQVVRQHVFKTLVIKEWRKFISSPMYAMNSGIGLVMMLIFASSACFIARPSPISCRCWPPKAFQAPY
jgi:hypothetical protein